MPTDECDYDSDCSENGVCVTTDSTFYPKMQCFCNAGWFGEQCKKSQYYDMEYFIFRILRMSKI